MVMVLRERLYGGGAEEGLLWRCCRRAVVLLLRESCGDGVEGKLSWWR